MILLTGLGGESAGGGELQASGHGDRLIGKALVEPGQQRHVHRRGDPVRPVPIGNGLENSRVQGVDGVVGVVELGEPAFRTAGDEVAECSHMRTSSSPISLN